MLRYWLLLAFIPSAEAQRACAGCHAKIYETYSRTAMARSFYRPSSSQTGEYFHEASNTHFSMIQRDGRLVQRRWQIGYQGREENVDEKSVDYVIGSGNHTKTYLHRTASGALQQLPLAWYAEKGGFWAMNPGYDKPDQPNARRKINYECMGCHNTMPSIPADHNQPRAEPVYIGALPEGISCQRCHGLGDHSTFVKPGNEVCLQCHLETTSFPFPHSIEKYDGSGTLYFDHPEPDRFQIVSAAYRMRMSKCKVECTTCHDPHDDSPKDYNAVCGTCHERHIAGSCVDCHMPKRRTDDVVHVVMTDHFIQRRKPAGDLIAAKPERNGPETVYHGEVLSYGSPADELYLASAQVLERNNLEKGIPRLKAAIAKYRPAEARFYINLADALLPNEAISVYQEAIRRKPSSLAALMGLGLAFDLVNQPAKSADAFRRATQALPSDASAWLGLGQQLMKLNLQNEANSALQKSIQLDPEIPETHYAFGTEASLREAIRLQPDYAAAHLNLAIILARSNLRNEANFHFKEAIRLRPNYPLAQRNYNLFLSGGR